jgi:lipopolysaccharide/colanic/teichoic acid biosynthesis glycosyltransferase
LLKRAFDVVLSGTGLLVSAPAWVLIAAAIKLQDGGPVFFAQERVGRHGRIFEAYKFRSMVPDAERSTGAVQACENDPRVTRVGRWLRATAMDELPQLWNIFRGDMSFVGPRPLRPDERDTTAPDRVIDLRAFNGFERRHSVRPGLTGIAQVYAARDVSRTRKFRYDLLYVRRQSFRLDLSLILQSFWYTATAAWERRGPRERRRMSL